MTHLVLTLTLLLAGPARALLAQSVVLYNVRVLTTEGTRIKGVLGDVSDTHVMIDERSDPAFGQWRNEVALSAIRKVVLRKQVRRQSTINGAIIGGLLTGATAVLSSQQSGFRSPALYGLNMLMAAGGGAAFGAVVGHQVGPVSRKVIRRRAYDGQADNASLSRQLRPFTYTYQNDVLNRVQF